MFQGWAKDLQKYLKIRIIRRGIIFRKMRNELVKTLKIIIGADIVPTNSNFELFEEGNVRELIGTELKDKLDKADFIIMNLETPLTDVKAPIDKCGPNLSAPGETISGLKSINPYFYTLANNHILDQGVNGLISTQRILEKNKIAYSGVGENLKAAKKPYIANIQGHRLGVYCCAEHEFSIASKDKAGANPFDPLESFDDVRKLREECDTLVVLFHGGIEHYRYPSPSIQKIFRKFANCGADLVVLQHSHCIGCKEEYKDSVLVYGQGNFLFDYSENEYWQTSLVIELSIDEKGKKVKYIPLKKDGNSVKLAEGIGANKIIDDFLRRSSEIEQEDFIEKAYGDLAKKRMAGYFRRISGRIGKSYFVRGLNKISRGLVYRYIYSRICLPEIINCFECEAHRELIISDLKQELERD